MKKIKPDTLTLDKACMAIATQKTVDSFAFSNKKVLLQNIENYLQTANNSTSISVVSSKPEAPDNVGSKSVLKINYAIKEEDNNKN